MDDDDIDHGYITAFVPAVYKCKLKLGFVSNGSSKWLTNNKSAHQELFHSTPKKRKPRIKKQAKKIEFGASNRMIDI